MVNLNNLNNLFVQYFFEILFGDLGEKFEKKTTK